MVKDINIPLVEVRELQITQHSIRSGSSTLEPTYYLWERNKGGGGGGKGASGAVHPFTFGYHILRVFTISRQLHSRLQPA